MKGLKALRIGGAALAAAGIVGVGVSACAPAAMIVAIGIHGVSAISTVSGIVLGTGAAAAMGGTIPAVVSKIKAKNNTKLLESEREHEMQNFSEYAKDSLNPEKTRIRLEQLRKNNALLNDVVDKCLEQMDKMDNYQSRQKSLIAANEAIYLNDTIDVIDESERRMCRNFRNIINCCILVENSSGIDELDTDTINLSMTENEDELKEVATLLKYFVGYINNYNRNGVKDRSELDAWLKVMKSSIGGNNETVF